MLSGAHRAPSSRSTDVDVMLIVERMPTNDSHRGFFDATGRRNQHRPVDGDGLHSYNGSHLRGGSVPTGANQVAAPPRSGLGWSERITPRPDDGAMRAPMDQCRETRFRPPVHTCLNGQSPRPARSPLLPVPSQSGLKTSKTTSPRTKQGCVWKIFNVLTIGFPPTIN